ncbi:hypothetical protein Ahy_A10g050488 [Arachis hypogaea]|uniref:MULE transposase domain-containing protein n=1 Tax=Arachis hypogaea TaxID=3818 RepID=A0A445B9G8_ARAHY|nr:hypothetical protein Ahy_A10g050488 [Arachis hypogaea]
MLPNQTQPATIANEAPNLGDNHETHVEEADGRGRRRRKKHPKSQPSGRAQPAPQKDSDAHAGQPKIYLPYGHNPQFEGLAKFRSLYICLDTCKRRFKQGCRPFLCLYGAFLKGYFGEKLLTVVAQDANNHLFPVAYGVILEIISNLIGTSCQISKMFCTMHIWRNFNKCWKDLELKQLLFQCVKALTDQEFNEGMAAIKRINTSV